MSEIVYLDFYKDVYLERKNYDEFGRMIEQHPLYELCYDGSTPVTIDTPAIPSYDSLIKLQKNIIIMIETNDRNIPTAKDHPIKKQMSAYRFKESNKSDVIEVGKAKTIERLKTMNPNLINIHEEILTPEDETVYIDLLRQGGFVVLFLTEFLLIVRMINNSRCIKKYVACCVIIVLILILLIYQTHNSITSLRSASDLTYNVIVTILRSKIDYINRTTIVTGDFVDSRFINNVISLNYML
jgi:magnesium-transporting ATPase (P-type)